MAKDQYTMNVECGNCGYRGRMEFPKGTDAQSNRTCPSCGCRTCVAKPVAHGPGERADYAIGYLACLQ